MKISRREGLKEVEHVSVIAHDTNALHQANRPVSLIPQVLSCAWNWGSKVHQFLDNALIASFHELF